MRRSNSAWSCARFTRSSAIEFLPLFLHPVTRFAVAPSINMIARGIRVYVGFDVLGREASIVYDFFRSVEILDRVWQEFPRSLERDWMAQAEQ